MLFRSAALIAEIALHSPPRPHLKPIGDLRLMSRWVEDNLSVSLRAFADLDLVMAESVIRERGYIDDVYDQVLRRLFTYIASEPPLLRYAQKPMAVAQALQHAGDHVVDIAELTVIMLRAGVR